MYHILYITRAYTLICFKHRFGLSDLVTVTCQDVCARYDTEHLPGFRDIPQNYADAVFLGMYICIYSVLCNTEYALHLTLCLIYVYMAQICPNHGWCWKILGVF